MTDIIIIIIVIIIVIILILEVLLFTTPCYCFVLYQTILPFIAITYIHI